MDKILKKALKNKDWLDKAIYQESNEGWLSKSFAIAVKILIEMDERNMDREELAKGINKDIDTVKNILKGKENLDLKTISEIENFLKIELI